MPKNRPEYFVDKVYEHIGIIYKICNMYARESEKSDLQQEIIYQLWKSFPSFKGNARFQTWMYRVALNTALLGLRKRKRKVVEVSHDGIDLPDESIGDKERQSQIQELYFHISKLNDIDKAIIFLYLELCSYEEISDITGLGVKNISVRLVRIKEKLRKMFNNQTL